MYKDISLLDQSFSCPFHVQQTDWVTPNISKHRFSIQPYWSSHILWLYGLLECYNASFRHKLWPAYEPAKNGHVYRFQCGQIGPETKTNLRIVREKPKYRCHSLKQQSKCIFLESPENMKYDTHISLCFLWKGRELFNNILIRINCRQNFILICVNCKQYYMWNLFLALSNNYTHNQLIIFCSFLIPKIDPSLLAKSCLVLFLTTKMNTHCFFISFQNL